MQTFGNFTDYFLLTVNFSHFLFGNKATSFTIYTYFQLLCVLRKPTIPSIGSRYNEKPQIMHVHRRKNFEIFEIVIDFSIRNY